jgi:glutamate receptor ionotropic, NMDA 3A
MNFPAKLPNPFDDRKQKKTFYLSPSTALWVMWGLLCGHLVAFKAPKSWPNKFLINVWGGFSVIFIASYTANIAALIAGLFFHNAANTYDTSVSSDLRMPARRIYSRTDKRFPLSLSRPQNL